MKNDRTVWVKFARTIIKIAFVAIIVVGSLTGIIKAFIIRTGGSDFILLGLFYLLGLPALSVLAAFCVCSVLFIKLDMAEDIHAIKNVICEKIHEEDQNFENIPTPEGEAAENSNQ